MRRESVMVKGRVSLAITERDLGSDFAHLAGGEPNLASVAGGTARRGPGRERLRMEPSRARRPPARHLRCNASGWPTAAEHPGPGRRGPALPAAAGTARRDRQGERYLTNGVARTGPGSSSTRKTSRGW